MLVFSPVNMELPIIPLVPLASQFVEIVSFLTNRSPNARKHTLIISYLIGIFVSGIRYLMRHFLIGNGAIQKKRV